MEEVRQAVTADDEISLLDIYDFLRDGWLTLVGMTVAGLGVGVVVSLLLPVKYEASGLIESGRVGFATLDQNVGSREVEPLSVLAEKMKAPGFYDEKTLSVCGLDDNANPRQALIEGLSPSVARNSNFVSVTYQAESVEAAKACVNAVLTDVVASQQPAIDAVVRYTETEIERLKNQVEQAESDLDATRLERDERIDVVREQLAVARQELKLLQERQADQVSTRDALSDVQVLNKRSEVQQFESLLLATQSNFNDLVLDRNDQITRLTARLTALQTAVEYPNTSPPEFATPVFAAHTKVSPRRSLIAAISLVLGGFLGLMILIGRRAMKHIKAHEAQRQENTQAQV